MTKLTPGRRQRLALGAGALLAIGAAGGGGAVALTRPPIEMAPTIATPIARLPASDGIVTVKGRVAEVFGDRFVVQDGSGRAMIDAGRNARSIVRGAAVTVQGRYDGGQLRARFLIDSSGRVSEAGPAHGPRGPRGPGGPGREGPHGPRGNGPPPPPAGSNVAPPPVITGAPAPAPAATTPR